MPTKVYGKGKEFDNSKLL